MTRIKIFLIWLILVNSPVILIAIPIRAVRVLSFIPILLWINIPALWLGLATAIGKPHYDIQEFGALPHTPLAWTLIAAFWILLAAVLTVLTAYVRGLIEGHRKK